MEPQRATTMDPAAAMLSMNPEVRVKNFDWAWRTRDKVWAMCDTGFGRSAGPKGLAKELRIEESEASRSVAQFSTAKLEPAQGQKRVVGWMPDGRRTVPVLLLKLQASTSF